VISGPSGAGKGSICHGLAVADRTEISVSMTTRKPRPGEEEGKSYYFVEQEAFREMIEQNGFYEYAEVYGEYYGTPKQPVLDKLDAGKDVILEIDTQGAMQIKKAYSDAVLIFILPPSFAELRKRIEGRGSESQGEIERRMSKAKSEIDALAKYDYCIVNRALDDAIDEVEAIMRAERIMQHTISTWTLEWKDKRVMRRADALRVSKNANAILARLAE
jgi:guanylate kinase